MLLPEPAPDYSEDRFYTGSPDLKPLPFTTACTAKKLPPHACQRVTNRLYYGKGAQRKSGGGGGGGSGSSAAAADDADAAGGGGGPDSILRRRRQQSPLWRREQKLQKLREARSAALDAPHNPSVVHKRRVAPSSMDVLTQRLSEAARQPHRTSDADVHVGEGGWRRTTDVTQRAKQYRTMADPHLRGFWLRREVLLQVSTGSLARSTRYQSFTKAPTVPTGDRLPTLPPAATRGAATPQHRCEETEDLFRHMPADLEACCRTPQGSVQALLPPLQQPHASSDDIEHIIGAGATPSPPAKPVESAQRAGDGDGVSVSSSDTSSYESRETSPAATPRGDADAASLSQSQSQSRASSPPPLRAQSSRSSSASYSSGAPSSGGVV